MFAKMLSEEEKSSYLSLLYYLSNIDNNITDVEKNFIENAANEIHYQFQDFEEFNTKFSLEEILSNIKTLTSKKIVVLELIGLVKSDPNHSDLERNGIIHISRLFGIDDSAFLEIEKWVIDGINWSNYGLKLIGE